MDFTKLPSILTPDLGLLFWMLLAFIVVFFVLAKFGFPAIINMVTDRKNYIDESLRKAHEATERMENIKQESEAMLQEARERQAQILKEATETREDIVTKAQEKAKEEGERIMREAVEKDRRMVQSCGTTELSEDGRPNCNRECHICSHTHCPFRNR